jgi:hypothetical protein
MSLCIECACSLCCDGTMYGKAALIDSDLPMLNERIAAVMIKDDRATEEPDTHFKLPCRLCIDQRCSIHGQERPAICGDYKCELLVAHEEGRVSVAEARALVNSIKTLRERLAPRLKELPTHDERHALSKQIGLAIQYLESEEGKNASKNHNPLRLDIAMLRVMLGKNFDSSLTRYTSGEIGSMQAARRRP